MPCSEEFQTESSLVIGINAHRGIGNCRERTWSASIGKRVFDVTVAILALVLCSPLLLIAAIAVKVCSPGPLFFRQTRMGRGGREFRIWKFRTMYVSTGGPAVTKAGDKRLTPAGRILRRLKIDELPQLINVVCGDMSLVGARPKVPHHQVHVLRYRPGITGAASLAFRNEEELLQHVPEERLDDYQVHVLMPLKRELDNHYMDRATFFTDLVVLFKTALGLGAGIDESQLVFQHSLVALGSALSSKVPNQRNLKVKQAS
jgi:lipopolysaccharide/colanic/teichoic acid biosynthesis glycosyltransferase